jgi:RNA polymerase sigma-70 factor (ECF subfamily)
MEQTFSGALRVFPDEGNDSMNMMSTVIHAPPPQEAVPPDDEQLVLMARRSPAQFALLYDRHMTGVYRYLLSMVGNVKDAEDLTSQTFLEALENLHRYRGKGDFRAWLFRIARNKSIDHYRKHRRDTTWLEDADYTDGAQESPETAAENALAVAAVLRQLRTLSPDRAEVVSLRLFAGLEVKEIANALSKPEAAVRMLLHRGLRDLQARVPAASRESAS